MTDSEKLILIAENQQKVYKAGQDSMVDETKIIEKTATGTGLLVLDDVSEIPHKINAQLTGGTSVTVYGENLLDPKTFDGRNAYSIDANGLTLLKADNSVATSIQPFATLYAGTYTISTTMPTACRIQLFDDEGSSIGSSSSGTFTFTLTKPTAVRCKILAVTGGTYPVFVGNVMLSFGGQATGYVPYHEPMRYTSTSDGSITAVKSLSPFMIIMAEAADINISATYHKSYGMQTEHDRFWDNYQDGGNRLHYNYAFAGKGWTDQTFRPKYDIRPTSATNMFSMALMSDVRKLLNDAMVEMDLSKVVSLSYVAQSSDITALPTMDVRMASNLQYFIQGNSKLNVVEKVILNENGSQTFGNYSFGGNPALVEIRFEGKIGQNGFNIQDSKLLSHESLMSIISVLQDKTSDTSGTVWTITIGADNIPKLTDDELSQITQKGWIYK